MTRKDKEKYKLVGILNVFDVIPDFIYPIFERDNQHFFQQGDDKSLKLEEFVLVKESVIDRIVLLKDLQVNASPQTEFTISSKPLFGFQFSDEEVYLGFYEEMKEFLLSFETEDTILKKEISDFLHNCGENQL